MVLPDVNVLLRAFRPELQAHEASAAWLQAQIDGPAPFGVADRVIEGFVRIVTHPGGFDHPEPVPSALEFVEMLLSRDNCVRVNPGPLQWEIFVNLVRETGAVGNSVSDAWLAALAIESGSEWITWDKGFARYPGLRWSTPATFA